MINYLALVTALVLSVVAAYYSIVGLTAIFAAAFWPIVIMGSTLEIAKVVSVSWVYRNWKTASASVKYYLTAAIIVLMIITSLGTFGYLSKAHLDQNVPTGDVAAKVQLIDDKIQIHNDTIATARKALKQMDDQVDQILARSDKENSALRANNIRKSQQRERNKLLADISKAQDDITKLREERAPVASQLRKVEAEVGPIKYVAELIYGKEAGHTMIDSAVRFVIILIVAVFDPLAIVLLIAANSTLNKIPEPAPATPAPEPPKEKKSEPKWTKKTKELNRKRKAGTIEIDPKKIRIINDGGQF